MSFHKGKIIDVIPTEPISTLYTNIERNCVHTEENTYLVKIEYQNMRQYFLESELKKY
jgi:hypothetical protein